MTSHQHNKPFDALHKGILHCNIFPSGLPHIIGISNNDEVVLPSPATLICDIELQGQQGPTISSILQATLNLDTVCHFSTITSPLLATPIYI